MSRTRKQPYRKSRAFDTSCRCHGGCPWCAGNRLHNQRVREYAARDAIDAFVSYADHVHGRVVDWLRRAAQGDDIFDA